MLPKEAIEQFKEIWKKYFPDIELSDEDASRRADNLVNLYKAVLGDTFFGQIKDLTGAKETSSK